MRQLPPPHIPLAMIEHGQIGVTLFIVISGFILSHIVGDADLDVPKFYLNRMLRIYPLFIFIVALGYFVTPDPRETQTGIDFLLALLPISNLYRLHYGTYGGMMWSIAVELQFYLIFPFFWRLLRVRGASVGLVLIAFMIGTRAGRHQSKPKQKTCLAGGVTSMTLDHLFAFEAQERTLRRPYQTHKANYQRLSRT